LVQIFTRNELAFHSNVSQFLFRDWLSVQPGSNAEFIIKNANASTQVWDITFPHNLQLMQGVLNGTDYKFTNNSSRLREYIAFNNSDFLTPISIGKIANQDLHNSSPVDMLIIAPQELISQAAQLAQWHQQRNGLKVKWVTTDEVYNEFGSGSPDPTAIRDFVKMYYDKYAASATDKLKYLLLFGDASFDYKARIKGNTNLVPAFETDQSLDALATYTSDDFFGFLDDNEDINSLLQTNLLDIGIGRVPAKILQKQKILWTNCRLITLRKVLGHGEIIFVLLRMMKTIIFIYRTQKQCPVQRRRRHPSLINKKFIWMLFNRKPVPGRSLFAGKSGHPKSN
jgi:hypothetical protein